MSGRSNSHHRSSSTFVDEYAGVSGLYSHLAQCWRHQPPFLRRNLASRRDAYESEMRELNEHAKSETMVDEIAANGPDRGERGGAGGTGLSQSAKAKKATLDLEEQTTSRKSSHSSKGLVVYRLRFNEGLQECVQKKNDYQCVWCEATWKHLDNLMAHLAAAHDRLDYTLINSSPPEVYVSVAKRANRIHVHEDISFVSAQRGGTAKLISGTGGESSASSSDEEEVAGVGRSEAGAAQDDNDQRGQACGKKRERPTKAVKAGEVKSGIKKRGGGRTGKEKAQRGFNDRDYYRSQTCLKIHPDDMDYDSDDDVDDEWQIQRAEELMDEFVDVTTKEKTFMKLWNRFVHKHAILADFHVPDACTVFAKHHVNEIVAQDLRDEMLLHMFALWDFNLINKDQILEIIKVVDDHIVGFVVGGSGSSSKCPGGEGSGGSSSREGRGGESSSAKPGSRGGGWGGGSSGGSSGASGGSSSDQTSSGRAGSSKG